MLNEKAGYDANSRLPEIHFSINSSFLSFLPFLFSLQFRILSEAWVYKRILVDGEKNFEMPSISSWRL